MGSRCFPSCFSRAGPGCREGLAQLGVVYHACNPSLQAEPEGRQVYGELGLSLKCPSAGDSSSVTEHLPGICKPWVQFPGLKQKRRRKRRWPNLPLLYHGRPCPVAGLLHRACLSSGISEATTGDWVGGLGMRQEPHRP